MEVVRTSHSKPRSRAASARLLGGAVTGILGANLLAGCTTNETTPYVDCKQTPDGSVSVTVDTWKTSTVHIGDAVEGEDGDPLWRNKITVRTFGNSTIQTELDNPPVSVTQRYHDLVPKKEPVTVVSDEVRGSHITAYVPFAIGRAAVTVAYNCWPYAAK